MDVRYDPQEYVPLTGDVLHFLLCALGSQGVEDLHWSENISPPEHSREFAIEVIFVICNSGMKNTIARRIFEKCMTALDEGRPVGEAFGHQGKSTAIERIWAERDRLFQEFTDAEDKLAFLADLPWIGNITKYHLAKNFGLQVAKPDVHLERLAKRDGSTVQELCERLAREANLKVATVDTILWRACANGVLDSRTGLIPCIEQLNAIRDVQKMDQNTGS